MKIQKILSEKKNEIHTIGSGESLKKAAQIFSKNHIGSLLVINPKSENSDIIGIITERDIINTLCYEDAFYDLKVDAVMSNELIIAEADDNVDYIMRLMTQKRIRHIPIVDEGQVIGVVSIGDIIKSLHIDDEIKIRSLGDYLGGTYKLEAK